MFFERLLYSFHKKNFFTCKFNFDHVGAFGKNAVFFHIYFFAFKFNFDQIRLCREWNKILMYSLIKFGWKSVHLLEVFGTFPAKPSGNTGHKKKSFHSPA